MSKSIPHKPKKIRNKKLLLQVGIIVTVIFLLITIATDILLYFGGTKLYLRSKNEMIDRDLLRLREEVMKVVNLEWMLDYCDTHAEQMSQAFSDSDITLTDEEQQLVYDFYERYGGASEIKESDLPQMTEDLNNASEEVQFAVAKNTYQTMLFDFYFAQYQTHYDKLYCIDIREENRGFLYCAVAADNKEEFLFTDVWDYPVEKHPAVEKLLKQTPDPKSDNTIYETATIDADPQDYYIGYIPIVLSGKVRCVICISFDWSEFRNTFMPYIIAMFSAGIVILVISAGVLLLFLHRSAIHPVRKIMRTVRKYMEDKDSESVVAELDTIRTKNEFGVLSDDICELAQEIERYNEENIRLVSEQEKVAAELDLAAKIQSDMLPKKYPNRPEFDLFALMNPAKEVGGDFYDFFMTDRDHLCMVIADVSGKGVPASLYMMMSMIIIRNYARAGKSPAEVLSKANRSICEHNDDRMFVTVWYGTLELSTGHVVAANAGHEYPILRKANGEFELFKDKHGFVLGALPEMMYREYAFDIEKGGTLFLYTDGAAEATDAEEQLFGTERMLEALNRDPDRSPKELIDGMLGAIDAFVGKAPQYDDLTMLCVRYNGTDDA